MIEIREEKPEDRAAVAALNTAVLGEGEARLVQALHRDGDVVAALVAVEDGEIAGHILFSKLPIETDDGVMFAVALAPMAVRADRQLRGIGSALVRQGLATARDRGAMAAVVLGHPGYYPRFGFSASWAQGLESPYSGSDAFMAMELVPNGLGTGAGVLHYAPAFEDL
jgi:putative acetyltransferase